DGYRLIGLDLHRPRFDLTSGAVLAAVVGLPGLGLYLAAYQAGFSARIAPANLPEVWWAVPVLVLAALQNSLVEEVVGVGYLLTRLQALGWRTSTMVAGHALLRGTYHLYQGFGGFIGNAAMGVLFALFYLRVRRDGRLVVGGTLLGAAACVGSALLRGWVSWLQ